MHVKLKMIHEQRKNELIVVTNIFG